jgi:Lon protease-like protein
MRRELPTHPHIDHLKKQAKDLLEGHRGGDAEALERVVASLPAFAKMSVQQAAAAPFALHDAQSTIAREYGFASWSDLRTEVERRGSEALPESFLRALAGRPLPPEVTAALAQAWEARRSIDVPPEMEHATLPLIAFRDAILTPGAIAPIHVGRAASVAAIDAALETKPSLLAVFSQRDAAVEEPSLIDLYPVGCVALVTKRIVASPGTFVVVQGQWWAAIASIDGSARRSHATATVRPWRVSDDLPDPERDDLVQSLRERANRLARAMPQAERAVALIESIRTPARLCDLVVANLPCAVEEKARYAAEPTLRDRLRTAIALCEAQIAVAPH